MQNGLSLIMDIKNMSSQYRKIKYQEEGPYGSIVDRYLYIWSHDTVDVTRVFDDAGEELFSYSDSISGFDMGQALAIVGSDWKNEKMEMMTRDEIDLIRNEKSDNYIKIDEFDKTLKLLHESTHDKDLRESILKVQKYKTDYLDK